jgi:sarcosine oxidase subunit alpha
MVLDDGTVARLADDRFLLTTTTGNAARVLDWMEEWLQTEWPHLRAWCTSVTEQWATLALVGPRSRRVLAKVCDLDLSVFPFMTWRDTVVARLPARVCRISFSGELAYEVSVAWWSGPALWAALVALGATPYGTEAMHVLRAEKGYPIVGQDTDGTVTPHDLGLGWAVSRKKADFVGMRSLARPDTSRPDRKQLVGLLPDDPTLRLPEGSHLLDPATPARPLGHVTSSYHSGALGRTFALALLASGRDRIGSRVEATLLDGDGLRTVPATVVSAVLYDPDNTRRDGGPGEAAMDPVASDPAPAVAALPKAHHADGSARVSPLAGWSTAFDGVAARTDGRLRLAELPFLDQLNVRLSGAHTAAPNSTVAADGRTTLWLGPDEALIVGATVPMGGAVPGPGVACAVDVSAARAAVVVSGPLSRRLLAFGCALDLHPAVFEVGRCAQTMVAKAPVVLWRPDDDEYRLLVSPSRARYLAAWLLDAADGLGRH